MKLTMEINIHNTGEADRKGKPGEKAQWTRVSGIDMNGRYARAVLYESRALALNAKLKSILGDDPVTGKRLVVTMDGEWRDEVYAGKTNRSFHAKEFDILDGMALEGARLRADALAAIKRGEELRKAGQLALAYNEVSQFTARFAGVPLDLEAFLEDAAEEEAAFGMNEGSEADPEAAAAAHFARTDRVRAATTEMETVTPAPAAEPEDAAAAEDLAEPMDFASDESEMGVGPDEPPLSGDIQEEDAIMIDPVQPTHDVLDDANDGEPAEEQNARPVNRPDHSASKPFVSPAVSESPAAAAPAARRPSAGPRW